MKRNILLLAIAVLTTFLGGSLFAGYDPSVNPLDPGFEIISVTDVISGFTYEGRLDYDVHAPGEYTEDIAILDGGSISAAAFADQYVYQYQITSTQGYGDGLSIALELGSGATNFGYSSTPPSGVIPDSVYDAGSQVKYGFIIADGQSTTLLLYTSPNAPKAGNAMVSGMMAGSQSVPVPVPVPEPVTLILLGAGCLQLRCYRKRSRKAA
ncbi:MAG: PEP-CTERM sorting domain-containing protein [Planctomycetes bacterium]|nr:PEP-CTERM sorting domain-containing protein [Planctomycetota bacterium]